MTNGYTLRWFQDGDTEAFISGLNRNLYDNYDERRFRWKHLENPHRLGFVSIVVVEEEATGRPVGFNGFLPLEARIGAERFTVVQGCDGFMDHQHRRRGLFQRTIDFMSRELTGRGPEFLIGFNFPGSAAVAQKAGSILVGDIYRWSHKLKEIKATADGLEEKKNVALVPCSLEEIHEMYERWAESTRYLHLHRSMRYLRWRFEKSPLRGYNFDLIELGGTIRGYITSSITEEEDSTHLNIDDYIFLGSDICILVVVRELMERHGGLDAIEILALMGGGLEGSLRGLGFRREPEPMFSLIMKNLGMAIRGDRLILGGLEISQPEKWHLTGSDIF